MSSLIDRMKARISGMSKPMFGRPKPQEKSTRTIVTNRWDEATWKQVRKAEKIDTFIDDLLLGDEHRGGERAPIEFAPETVHDLFMTFYKAAPELVEKRDLKKEVYPVRKIIEEIIENPKLQELQVITANDPVLSTIAVDAVADTVREILSRIPPPPPPTGGQPGDEPGGNGTEPGGKGKGKGEKDEDDDQDQDKDDQNDDQDDENDGDDQDEPNNPGDGPESGNDETESEELDWDPSWDDLLDDLDLDRVANKALDEAEKEALELDKARRNFGLDDAEWQTMSPEERFRLAEWLQSPSVKEMTDAIGRMKRYALGVKATRINDVPHVAYDVETGNDLRRLLQSEFALLATDATKYQFYRKYADKELLQFKMRGTEDAGKGPIVVCIDKSGSMSGKPMTWALGVAEAMRRFAADEDRDVLVMFFGTNRQRVRFEFPKGKAPFEKIKQYLSTYADGGTEFDGVLTEALERASTAFDGDGQGKADIVFITDGAAYLDDAWIERFNAERERVGVRLFSVYIGGAYDMGYANSPTSLLNRISDVVIPVSDLRPEDARQIFAKV